MSIRQKLKFTLERIRNPHQDDNDKDFVARMGFLRLMIFLPFLVAAIIFFLLSLK